MGTATPQNVRMGDTRTPFVSAADGALRAAGWWEDEAWMLVGLTGLGFHVVADPGTCPSSPTAYDWTHVHTEGMRRIGIASRCLECLGDAAEFERLRPQAVEMITASLDRGVPAVIRTFDYAEFAIVTGYDDADGVFFNMDVTGDPDPILYGNLGKPHGHPVLFAQVFESRRAFDPTEAARSSLAYAIECWRGRGPAWELSYGSNYRIGAAAYGVLVDVVERASSDPLGLRYILRILADARAGVARYTARLRDEGILPGIEPVAERYAAAAPLLGRVAELLPAVEPWERPLDPAVLPEAASLLRQAAGIEEEAVAAIERILAAA